MGRRYNHKKWYNVFLLLFLFSNSSSFSFTHSLGYRQCHRPLLLLQKLLTKLLLPSTMVFIAATTFFVSMFHSQHPILVLRAILSEKKFLRSTFLEHQRNNFCAIHFFMWRWLACWEMILLCTIYNEVVVSNVIRFLCEKENSILNLLHKYKTQTHAHKYIFCNKKKCENTALLRILLWALRNFVASTRFAYIVRTFIHWNVSWFVVFTRNNIKRARGKYLLYILGLFFCSMHFQICNFLLVYPSLVYLRLDRYCYISFREREKK